MYTILQDSNNNLQLPFKGDYLYLLIVFTYRNKSVAAIFQNNSGVNCDYEITIIEVGSEGIVDVNNGQIKLSPRGTWKAKIYGQQDNINLAPENATLLYDYNLQIKGDSCMVYPVPNIACPDATAVVKDQNGNVLATQNIPSGVSQDIEIEIPEIVEPFYTYNYPALNTGQDVSYAEGDDKWVRDNVFNPEVNSWPTDRPWVFPVLDPSNPLLLLRGATPSGNNFFGNKQRFTDENGEQLFDNYFIDHLTGLAHTILSNSLNWEGKIANALVYNFKNFSDYFVSNTKIHETIFFIKNNNIVYNYPPFNSSFDQFFTSTTTSQNTNEAYYIQSNFRVLALTKANTTVEVIYSRKAFTYNPLTQQMELS